MTDPGFAKAGWTMAIEREPVSSGSSWQIRSPGGGHRGSLKLKPLVHFIQKRGEKFRNHYII